MNIWGILLTFLKPLPQVLSISKNRIETIPAYVGEMSQLQFLKIEQNPITFPPPEIVEFSGQDMDGWLNNLKSFLSSNRGMMSTELLVKLYEIELTFVSILLFGYNSEF